MTLVASMFRALNNVKDELPKETILTHVQSKFALKEDDDFSHLTQRKTRLQLVLISACVCGIEFCYAAETAFVTPILLQIGVPVMYMTLVWCLSPLLGIFLVPILGSLSDKCPSRIGRRRPFIMILSCGIVLGLILVPEGKSIGKLIGDVYEVHIQSALEATTEPVIGMFTGSSGEFRSEYNKSHDDYVMESIMPEMMVSSAVTDMATSDTTSEVANGHIIPHTWSILFTVIGVVMLDFSCDACQSPCRAYMLDVTIKEDHSLGLSTFTVLAGLGGCLGYIFGGIDWGSTSVGASFGSQVRVVFSIVLFMYIICLILTITSIKEMPLDKIGITEEDLQKKRKRKCGKKYKKFTNEESETSEDETKGKVANEETSLSQGRVKNNTWPEDAERKPQPIKNDSTYDTELANDFPPSYQNQVPPNKGDTEAMEAQTPKKTDNEPIIEPVSLKTYLKSIIKMPRSIAILCLTNLFCWMSLVCYSLYFTDFVGQAVYGGDPSSPEGSPAHQLYQKGVRMGSFGMSLYSLSCSLYSLSIERIIKRYGAKRVYILSQLVYTVGSMVLALTRHPVTVILLSPTAGIMYATLFTIPYVLIAHYHSSNTFQPLVAEGSHQQQPPAHPPAASLGESQVRGLGTDVAILSSMVFVAQFLLSSLMGSIIHYSGSTVAVVISASVLSFCGAITATQVLYLDL